MKLNNKMIQFAQPKEKPYKMADGGGLYLEITPQGSKLWRMKYRFLNKEKRLSIGVYPVVSLLDARNAREDAKKLLHDGIDPSDFKRDGRRESIRNAETTFKAIALEWLEHKKDSWSDNYYKKSQKGLELNVFPYIGNRPIKDITAPDLLDSCLRRIEKRGSLDIAGRTRQICGQVFRYGIQTGKCNNNPAEHLKGALKTTKTDHFRTIDYKALPEFIKALERNEARLFERTRRAVWLSLYTFCRPVEIRTAQWDHIDFKARKWTIPAQFMKMGKDHIVPLCDQVIDILKAQYEETKIFNTPYVFPSQIHPRKPMSDGTVNKAIKRLGYGTDMVAHGFRALARTTIREQLRYDSEIIEKQLAHKTKNPLGEAYDRTQFIDDRVKMMQDWADFVDGMR